MCSRARMNNRGKCGRSWEESKSARFGGLGSFKRRSWIYIYAQNIVGIAELVLNFLVDTFHDFIDVRLISLIVQYWLLSASCPLTILKMQWVEEHEDFKYRPMKFFYNRMKGLKCMRSPSLSLFEKKMWIELLFTKTWRVRKQARSSWWYLWHIYRTGPAYVKNTYKSIRKSQATQ